MPPQVIRQGEVDSLEIQPVWEEGARGSGPWTKKQGELRRLLYRQGEVLIIEPLIVVSNPG
jgi:hypothetical protein